METCGVFLWHFNLLCDNGSGLAFQGIDGIFQICDDCRASSSGCDKINGSTDLWKHGIYTELIGCDMFFCFFYRNMFQKSRMLGVTMSTILSFVRIIRISASTPSASFPLA